MNPPKLCPSSVQRPPSGAVGPSNCGRSSSQSLTMLSALQPAITAALRSQPRPSSNRHGDSQPSQCSQPHSRAQKLLAQHLTVPQNAASSAGSNDSSPQQPAMAQQQPPSALQRGPKHAAHSPSHAASPAEGILIHRRRWCTHKRPLHIAAAAAHNNEL